MSDAAGDEARFVAIGQSYEYKGEVLRKFVEERLQQLRERQEKDEERNARAQARELAKGNTELLDKIADLEQKVSDAAQQQQDSQQSRNEDSATSLFDGSGSRGKKTIKMPKYDVKQTVEDYLELFEDVAKQNEYESEELLIRLRVALAGSKLENACYGCSSFEQAKKELLTAYGKTADKAWLALINLAQKPEESFYQFVIRATRETEKWAKLAMPESDSTEAFHLKDDEVGVFSAIVRQVVLEAVGPDMKAFMIEKKCYTKSLKTFSEDGMAYQTAHGRSKGKASNKPAGDKKMFSSTQCLSISVEESERKLSRMSVGERRAFVARERLCWNCLKTGHRMFRCPKKPQCSKCPKKHHSLLHEDSGVQRSVPTENVKESQVGTYGCESRSSVYLMTGVAKVQSETRRANVRVFIDPGAQASFITEPLVDALQPEPLGAHRLKVTAFGAEPQYETMERYRVTIKGSTKDIEVDVWKKNALGLSFKTPGREALQKWKAHGIELSDQPAAGDSGEVHLLIGADFCNELLRGKKEIQGDSVWDTEVGWVLCGPSKRANPESVAGTSVACVEIERLWKMDEPPEASKTLPDVLLERKGTHYQVGLLCKSERRPANNLNQAMAAPHVLLKKLEKNGRRQLYDDVLIREYLELDAIEKEPHPEQPGYYMPHHAVFRQEASTTKTRVVFNASAAQRGEQSLNDHLEPGPSLLPDLAGLLLRFREYPVAFQADIRKAFFMIGMHENDRQYLRFVWPEIGQEEMCIWRLKKLPFGVNCSPFILSSVIRFHLDRALELASPEEVAIIQLLLRSFYVDDCISSVPCSADAEKLQEFSVNKLQEAGMELRKWRGNTIPSDPQAGNKALGIVWSTEDDLISVASLGDVDAPSSESDWSRRSLLRCVASVFDPLGLVSPAVLPGKMLLQDSWKLGGGWDDPLPHDLAIRCAAWWGGLESLSLFQIPRWIGCAAESTAELHVFADASEKGYGCCLYVVVGTQSTLLFAKAKVAPVSSPTLARLELQAAFLASKVLSFVVEQLRISIVRIVGWTDSLTTWHWISKPSYSWKTFVANRVAAIQEVAEQLSMVWKHCPGESNPADLVSRGVAPSGLESDMWLHGPEWLTEESQWPEPRAAQSTEDSTLEARVASVQVDEDAQVVWPWEKFSKWQVARGMVVRMLQWKEVATRAELYPRAEAFLYRAIQQECFQEELAALKAGKSLSSGSRLSKLSPFIGEDGLLRVGGRLQESQLGYDAKHPIILAKHPLTTLLLEMVHKQRLHQGVESVLAFLQRRFWILSGRRLLRSASDRCLACRWFRAKAAAEAVAPLPSDRVEHQQAFGLTGIDYAGPLYVRCGDQAEKRWIVLFVCGTTRAVHLDIVDSLSTEAFLLAFRRFVARRGKPSKIRSDNATTFKAAADKLDIVWVFNPPAAPWFGGFYERLVACVKTPLKKVLGRAMLRPAELLTVLTEIEAVVNARPLTSVSTDVSDDLALTPSMMLGDVFAPSASGPEQSLNATQLTARLRYIVTVKEHLVKRWRDEYVVKLSSYQSAQPRPIKQGDVVLVIDDNKKRHLWRLGRVLQLFPGRDGKCRVARVKIGQNTMLRAIPRLIPLEVAREPEAQAEPQTEEPAVDDASSGSPAKPDEPSVAAKPQEAATVLRSGRVVRAPRRLDL